MTKDKLTINIYDDDDNVVKTVTAHKTDLKFGIVRRLMEILNVEDINDNGQIFKAFTSAWEPLTKLLHNIFPDATPEEFDNVSVKELIPVVLEILGYSVAEIMSNMGDSKN